MNLKNEEIIALYLQLYTEWHEKIKIIIKINKKNVLLDL